MTRQGTATVVTFPTLAFSLTLGVVGCAVDGPAELGDDAAGQQCTGDRYWAGFSGTDDERSYEPIHPTFDRVKDLRWWTANLRPNSDVIEQWISEEPFFFGLEARTQCGADGDESRTELYVGSTMITRFGEARPGESVTPATGDMPAILRIANPGYRVLGDPELPEQIWNEFVAEPAFMPEPGGQRLIGLFDKDVTLDLSSFAQNRVDVPCNPAMNIYEGSFSRSFPDDPDTLAGYTNISGKVSIFASPIGLPTPPADRLPSESEPQLVCDQLRTYSTSLTRADQVMVGIIITAEIPAGKATASWPWQGQRYTCGTKPIQIISTFGLGQLQELCEDPTKEVPDEQLLEVEYEPLAPPAPPVAEPAPPAAPPTTDACLADSIACSQQCYAGCIPGVAPQFFGDADAARGACSLVCEPTEDDFLCNNAEWQTSICTDPTAIPAEQWQAAILP